MYILLLLLIYSSDSTSYGEVLMDFLVESRVMGADFSLLVTVLLESIDLFTVYN